VHNSFTIHEPLACNYADMAELIPFPLNCRASLVCSIVDGLEFVQGAAANTFWRSRIKGVVADLREIGLGVDAIRSEVHALQWAVQEELQHRSGAIEQRKDG
jgi:hypothetical protein